MIDALKNTAATLLGVVQTRLSLLGNELEAQKIMLGQLLALWLGVLFCAGLAILLLVGLVVSVWWEQRVWVLGVSVIVFFALTAWCFVRLKALLDPEEPMFGSSLAALQDDLAQLRAAAGTNAAAGKNAAAGQRSPGLGSE